MEIRLGRAIHSATEFVTRFRRTPFERLQHGQMNAKELAQRTHGGSDIIRRLEAARLATKDIPPDQRLPVALEAIKQSDIQNALAVRNSNNPPTTSA